MNITQTLTSLSKTGKGGPISDTEMVKWANATAAKGGPGGRQIRSFKDPSLTTGVFFLNLLEGLRPGIVDPSMVINVSESGDYEDRRQNGKRHFDLCNSGIFIRICDSQTCYFHCPQDERDNFLGSGRYCRCSPTPSKYFCLLILSHY